MAKGTFPGGTHPPANKITADRPIEALPLPPRLVVPMAQNLGAPSKPVVKKGDAVKRGTVIGEPDGFVSSFIHAPTSGTVTGIERVIDDDISILAFLSSRADKVEEFQPYHLPMLVEEFGRAMKTELDFVAEAGYTHRFSQSFKDDKRIDIPDVYWDYSTERILTMRRIDR